MSPTTRNIMNRAKLKEEIIADEGMVKHIYEDHLGYPTFGVGHLTVSYTHLTLPTILLV